MAKKRKESSKKKQLQSLKGKHFWMIIGVIFLISLVTIFSSINSNNLTGNVAIQTFAFEPEGRTILFEINEGGVKDAAITFSNQVKNGRLLFEPNDLIYFKGTAYSKMKVSADNIEFSNLNLIIKVSEIDLNRLGINRAELSLYVNGKKQPTIITEIRDGYNFYKANGITELGDFVIGKAKQVESAASITTSVNEVKSEVKPAEVVVEEPAIEKPAEEEREPLVGRAVEQKEGFFSRLFKKWFG